MTRLLTADEVAERLGVTKGWVWAQARAGRMCCAHGLSATDVRRGLLWQVEGLSR